MNFTIAVAGKGGTGKTTICGLIIKYLNEKINAPVFAIDADPNMNLNDVLGVKVENTIGSVREKTRSETEALPSGMSKIEYLDLAVNQSLIESSKFDLLVMGRPEGSGCYCAANHLIRRAIDKLSGKYKFIVIDNEAGMEHLSRHTTQNIDLLIIVADSSFRGLKAGIRIKELVEELKLNIKKQVLVVNMITNNLGDEYLKEISDHKMTLLGTLPEDKQVIDYDHKGIPLVKLPQDSKIIISLNALLDSLHLEKI